MKLTTEDIMGCACNRNDWTLRSSFNEWLESHDANVRAETLEDVMHDRVADLTPDELLQTAWDAACPVPEGRDASSIPADARIIWRMGVGHDYDVYVGIAGDMSADLPQMIAHGTVRTPAPLPSLIPDDCIAVWASLSGFPRRRVWVRDIDSTGSGNWSDGTTVEIAEALIDPVPIPKEES